jgi:hypothetical protein
MTFDFLAVWITSTNSGQLHVNLLLFIIKEQLIILLISNSLKSFTCMIHLKVNVLVAMNTVNFNSEYRSG